MTLNGNLIEYKPSARRPNTPSRPKCGLCTRVIYKCIYTHTHTRTQCTAYDIVCTLCTQPLYLRGYDISRHVSHLHPNVLYTCADNAAHTCAREEERIKNELTTKPYKRVVCSRGLYAYAISKSVSYALTPWAIVFENENGNVTGDDGTSVSSTRRRRTGVRFPRVRIVADGFTEEPIAPAFDRTFFKNNIFTCVRRERGVRASRVSPARPKSSDSKRRLDSG